MLLERFAELIQERMAGVAIGRGHFPGALEPFYGVGEPSLTAKQPPERHRGAETKLRRLRRLAVQAFGIAHLPERGGHLRLLERELRAVVLFHAVALAKAFEDVLERRRGRLIGGRGVERIERGGEIDLRRRVRRGGRFLLRGLLGEQARDERFLGLAALVDGLAVNVDFEFGRFDRFDRFDWFDRFLAGRRLGRGLGRDLGRKAARGSCAGEALAGRGLSR